MRSLLGARHRGGANAALSGAHAVSMPRKMRLWSGALPALIGAVALSGCSEGVLDPKGPIAAANLEILFNSLAIMLAIVIPTILATLGVYGVTSFAVAQRRQELGVRIALGAQPANVIRTILVQSARWIALGLLLGLGGGALLSRLLAGVLYEVEPLDPWTFLAMPLFLLAVALWAGYVPARKAARLHPLTALASPELRNPRASAPAPGRGIADSVSSFLSGC